VSTSTTTPDPSLFHLTGPEASGSGRLDGTDFVVLAGARARRVDVPSNNDATRRVRQQLLADGTLVEQGDSLVLATDHRFSSPSQAAAVLLGRTANGWIEWKDDAGRTLKERVSPAAEAELDFRRRWYQAHVRRFEADAVAAPGAFERQRSFRESATEALRLRDELVRTGDVEAFGVGTQAWALEPGTLAFNNPIGQMLINQLVKRSEDPAALARVLGDALAPPSDDAGAQRKLQELVDYIETIRVGAHPAPGRAPFVLSYFWALADRPRWPVIWPSAAGFIEYSVGEPLPPDPVERYQRFVDLVRQLDGDLERYERVASWWDTTRPVFLDPVILERCAFGLDPDAVDLEARAANAAVLVSVSRHLGKAMLDEVTRTAGRTLVYRALPRNWTPDFPRADMWADWSTLDGRGPAVRVWANQNGVSIGLQPGQLREGWKDEVANVLSSVDLPGFRLLAGGRARYGEDVGFAGGGPGMFTYAKWFDAAALAALDLPTEIVGVAATLQPLIDRLVEAPVLPPDDDPLKEAVDRFLSLGYPTPADEEHRADRARFAEMLAQENVGLVDPADLRQIWTTHRYGNPGPQSVLNTSLRDADAAELDRITGTIAYLCWGDEPDEERIERVLDDEALKVRGLGESVIMKLLAVCHPERFVPVYPYSGPMGKRRMLHLLEIDEPSADTRGQLQVRANDLLRARLDRFFPGDPWGMGQFLYRYGDWKETEPVEIETDRLAEVADELLVDRAFLDDIVALLEDKGQVVLYGPPGTGKTYLARKLAEALVPDPTRRSLVQFHPSTSYEDFFEGYRPETDAAGAMSYRLTPGPLAMIAERAREAPGKRHVMIIDEINRANLPKVLGELLFLLEYRDESVRTLYRPDDAFELPADLWFIGTMNTADRSIALIDAALRRRFHFVPFFPNQGPMEGLLGRWLASHDEPTWVGELVAMVNDELSDALGGPHLQLGPSHFMRTGLDEAGLRRIWRYNVEPFIEDQFFGDSAEIERFRFDPVLRRYRADAGLDEVATGAEDDADLRAEDGPV
jgi:5-methylcytosine-specific restriction protein B